MTFEIGDKVTTNCGLYLQGEWRDRGLKGKVVDVSTDFGGLLRVKFKGIKDERSLRPEYLILRKKAKVEEPEELDAPERERPFAEGDTVIFKQAVVTGLNTIEVESGIWAEVAENIPNSNLVVVDFEDGGSLTVAEEVLESEDDFYADGEQAEEPEGEAVPDLHEVKDNPEVQAALGLILDRIEEIKALLTEQKQGYVVNVFSSTPPEALFVSEESDPAEEEPAPEPVFKKAKEVKAGDLLYTEGGAYDKVDRIDTKASGYTSLYGAFGNRIAQVPSGRVVQVLEEVS